MNDELTKALRDAVSACKAADTPEAVQVAAMAAFDLLSLRGDELLATPTPAAREAVGAVDASEKAHRALLACIETIRMADTSTGYCMCGSSVEGHSLGDGHGAVDSGHYMAGQVEAQAYEAIRALATPNADSAAAEGAEAVTPSAQRAINTFHETLAKLDAEKYGAGYLVHGEYVFPQHVRVFTPAPSQASAEAARCPCVESGGNPGRPCFPTCADALRRPQASAEAAPRGGGEALPNAEEGDFDCPKAAAVRACSCGFCRALSAPPAAQASDTNSWQRKYMRLVDAFDRYAQPWMTDDGEGGFAGALQRMAIDAGKIALVREEMRTYQRKEIEGKWAMFNIFKIIDPDPYANEPPRADSAAAEGAEAVAINYVFAQEAADIYRLDYNGFCAALRLYLGDTTPAPSQASAEAAPRGCPEHASDPKPLGCRACQALNPPQPIDAPRGGGEAYTTGHCENHKKPGGCPLHNLFCAWPVCDRRPAAPPAAQASDTGRGEGGEDKYLHGGCTETNCRLCGMDRWERKPGMSHAGISPYNRTTHTPASEDSAVGHTKPKRD